MPHQCTSCGELFSDGSKKMLAGCTVCGGKKFQFIPTGANPEPFHKSPIIEAPPDHSSPPSPQNLNLNYHYEPPTPTPPSPEYIEKLQVELSTQFESIKILEPGQYELNLMELYNRDECIIAIQEDGHYVIQVPGYI
ncbi:MAG: Zn-ribbon domain-containing protein [Halobacteriales archaeon]|nr:Zn-ribbon domain-containing protein [Halobacteriales archaeon]|tara:strand:+ start:40 stop:450 length:411 start_codon:yes stop_codon:yes gene_type:complete